MCPGSAVPGLFRTSFRRPQVHGWLETGLRPVSPQHFLAEIPFLIETPVSIREAVREGDWATSIDLSGAYFHILIHQIDRKWLHFVGTGTFSSFELYPSASLWLYGSSLES